MVMVMVVVVVMVMAGDQLRQRLTALGWVYIELLGLGAEGTGGDSSGDWSEPLMNIRALNDLT